MKWILLFLLLFASPAWATGNDTEELCDSPGSGVTCHCSEPLTVNDGFQDNVYNPSGSTTKPCIPGGNPLQPSSGSTLTFVLGSAVTPSSGLEELTVGGDGYVAKIASGSAWTLRQTKVTFTNNTWCYRYYALYDPLFECNGNCNFKWPRQSDTNFLATNAGMQSSVGTSVDAGTHVKFNLGQDHVLTNEQCQNSPDSGCSSQAKLIRRGDSVSFEDMQTGWSRMEICYDHNLTAAQVTGSSGLNALYGSSLTRPGDNYLYMRVRITMVTGPNIGDVQSYGPGRLNLVQTVIDTGRADRATIFSSGVGSPGFTHTRSVVWLGYMMTTEKSPADPAYWIGGAAEIEGGTPVVPSPTESEGVNFGSGVNLTMVMP